ncbi:SAM-dependent methyltransferase [Wenzhouxiangella sp. EGI_FJ10305]|uniref:SAM-dependent methyltransferase n=1 Tax=Wenzhouxiangella sp. EGI_FJ10305 TaxID=3243768 RepID=UPI0035D82C43
MTPICSSSDRSRIGRLSVVGTGIRPGGHLTREAQHVIAAADCVFTVVDGLTLERLREINAVIESLQDSYAVGRQRDDSYAEMVQRILAPLEDGRHVCAAFYGHPGVFVWPAHEAVRRARAAGYRAVMYPGISAEDCLFADLGLDPALHGCQSFEATDFLLHARRFDPTAALILWQPITLGDLGRNVFDFDPEWVRVLAEVLVEDYPADHPVTIYEAAVFPLDAPRIEQVPLNRLHEAHFTQVSTLYLPPASGPMLSAERLERLGVRESDLALGAYQQYRRREG